MSLFPSGWLTGRWGWLIIWVTALWLLAILVVVCHFAHLRPWADVSPDRIAWYHQEECERVDTSGFLLQFHNFWSNFAYLAAGLMVLCLNDSWLGRFVGMVFIFLGIGSAWFHGTLTELGQTVDIMGVYAALLALLAYGFTEMIPLKYDDPTAWLIMFIAVVVGMFGAVVRTTVHFFDSDYFTPMLVIILVVYMVAGGLRYKDRGEGLTFPILGAATAGIVAVLFKFTDGDKNLFAAHGGDYSKCLYGPDSLVQGHAFWHALSAVMFVCVFEFFRSLSGRSRSVWPWRLPPS